MPPGYNELTSVYSFKRPLTTSVERRRSGDEGMAHDKDRPQGRNRKNIRKDGKMSYRLDFW